MSLLQQLAASADDRPFLDYLGRRWSRRALWQEAGRRAGALPPGKLALFLPNLPVTVTALLAAWRAGVTVALVDARQGRPALLAWIKQLQPQTILSLDLAVVEARLLPLLPADPPRLLLARMADQLPPLQRLLAPWLRGGAQLRRGAVRYQAWRELIAEPPALPERLSCLCGLLPLDERLLAAAPHRRERCLLALPLADPLALQGLIGTWLGGGELILSPRLDGKSLARLTRKTKPESVIG